MVLSTTTLGGVGAIVLLTAISGFFSSSELAVFSIARHRIDSLVAAGTPGSAALAKLRDEPHRFLVTVLVSNNVANIAAASVATAVLIQFFSPEQAATGATVFTSFFVIVFGEIAPKSYAVANAERHALRVARPIAVVQRVLRPVLFIFETATAAVNRLTGGDTNIESYLTREEIEMLLLSGEASGVLDTGEGTMIRSVLDLEEKVARGVMIPRTEMVAVPSTASLDDVVETCWNNRVSRVPVYGETRDDIRGIADLRDVLRARDEGGALSDVLTEVRFVPASQPVDELLTDMQAEGYRMAVVVDEFGTVTGLATLEDVVEEVVGELFDSGESDPIRVVDEDTAVVQGRATVAYVNDSLGLDLQTEGPFETIAGLVNYHLGELGEEGDRVELGAATITVLDATPRRVRRVRIEWVENAKVEDESGSP
ncbi:MAG: hemolysin family protein [Halanaeroarchaeum sp.]